jgi:hypothetical protein
MRRNMRAQDSAALLHHHLAASFDGHDKTGSNLLVYRRYAITRPGAPVTRLEVVEWRGLATTTS